MIKLRKFINKYFLQIVLLIIAFSYYLFFLNKNLVNFDEGYFVHAAQRIFLGDIPYKDFSLQYGPLYFYLLSFGYKLFGLTIYFGRFLSLIFCLSIIVSIFYLLNLLKIKSKKIIILVFLSIISFGYPLLNIPNLMWPTVFISILLIISFVLYLKNKDNRFLFSLGILIALLFLLKQNFALYYLLFYNLLFIVFQRKSIKRIFKSLLTFNLTVSLVTSVWIYYFFLKDNLVGLIEYINFSRNFIAAYAFSYPPLTNLFKPFGFIKLIPYYLPIFVLIFTLILIFKRKLDFKIILFSLSAVLGFFVAIYPQSDLLHVYPFFGLVLVSLILLFYKDKKFKYITIFVLLCISIGFYLTFFQSIYENYYLKDKSVVNLQRAKGILVENYRLETINSIEKFLNENTSNKDYVLFYPFNPLFYFIFDRKNPSKDSIYYVRAWRFYDDERIIEEIKQKKTKYVVAYGPYNFKTKLSDFINNQEKVATFSSMVIFKIKH
ncbi:MAG: hypothetical protein AAB532_03305 [Patescibacteria group bacterium]